VRDGRTPEALRARAAISLGPMLEGADLALDGDDPPIGGGTFAGIKDSLREVYEDLAVPGLVRRRVLEAAVRAPEDWQRPAIAAAYASADHEWRLTAVFCMGHVRGFGTQIVEALDGGEPELRLEAVRAAGSGEVEAAWPRLVAIVQDQAAARPLLLAAIEAIGTARRDEAEGVLGHLLDSDDEEVADAVHEALELSPPAEDDEED
jgi:hypothetical protein